MNQIEKTIGENKAVAILNTNNTFGRCKSNNYYQSNFLFIFFFF